MQSSPPEPAAASEPSAWSRLGVSLAAREKVERTLLLVDRARVQMLAYVRRSQLLASARAATDELLMAPPDLRVPDPSFVDELRFGNFGLAGEIADLAGRSPFAHAVVSEPWARELHGFGWLRHLDAVRAEDTECLARRLLQDWLQVGSRDKLFGRAPDNGPPLNVLAVAFPIAPRWADPRFYAAVLRSFERQASDLSAAGKTRRRARSAGGPDRIGAHRSVPGRTRAPAQAFAETARGGNRAPDFLPTAATSAATHRSRSSWCLICCRSECFLFAA